MPTTTRTRKIPTRTRIADLADKCGWNPTTITDGYVEWTHPHIPWLRCSLRFDINGNIMLGTFGRYENANSGRWMQFDNSTPEKLQLVTIYLQYGLLPSDALRRS